jgi:hypothetical protein
MHTAGQIYENAVYRPATRDVVIKLFFFLKIACIERILIAVAFAAYARRNARAMRPVQF